MEGTPENSDLSRQGRPVWRALETDISVADKLSVHETYDLSSFREDDSAEAIGCDMSR